MIHAAKRVNDVEILELTTELAALQVFDDFNKSSFSGMVELSWIDVRW